MRYGKMFFILAIMAFMANAAHASIISTYTEAVGSVNGIATSTNLITRGQSTLGGISATGFYGWNGADISYLNDNSAGSFNNGNGTALDASHDQWNFLVSLNTAINTKGYDITGINTISGWTSNFANQKYTVYYSTVSQPDTFISLGDYSLNSAIAAGNDSTQTSLQIALTDSSGVIASHVAKLEFVFEKGSWPNKTGGTDHNGTAYREVEVFGTAVPEPSTIAMCIAGLLGLLAYAWRKRRQCTKM